MRVLTARWRDWPESGAEGAVTGGRAVRGGGDGGQWSLSLHATTRGVKATAGSPSNGVKAARESNRHAGSEASSPVVVGQVARENVGWNLNRLSVRFAVESFDFQTKNSPEI